MPDRPSRSELIAHGSGLARFPGEEAQADIVGGHVMGVAVHAWLAGVPLRRWGPAWLDGGSMWLRFRLPVHVGDVLTLVVDDAPSSMDLRLLGVDGDAAATGGAAVGQPPFADPTSFRRAARPDPPLATTPEALQGAALGGMEFDYDHERDRPRLEPSDPFDALTVAHPAWIASGVNALLAGSVELRQGQWIHAGTAVHSLAPIPSGARVHLGGRVQRLFDANGRRFAEVDVLATADERPAMLLRFTIVYG